MKSFYLEQWKSARAVFFLPSSGSWRPKLSEFLAAPKVHPTICWISSCLPLKLAIIGNYLTKHSDHPPSSGLAASRSAPYWSRLELFGHNKPAGRSQALATAMTKYPSFICILKSKTKTTCKTKSVIGSYWFCWRRFLPICMSQSCWPTSSWIRRTIWRYHECPFHAWQSCIHPAA